LDVQCRAYNEQYNCNFVTVIPTNIYGPHDNFNLEDSHVIPALIHKCHQAKRAGVDFVVRGSGKPLRQFIYSEDLARLILRVLFSDVKESVILSPSREYSIREIATAIAGEYPVVFDTQWSDGQYRKQVDNSRLLELFPDFEFTPLEVGLQRTIDWFTNCKSPSDRRTVC
jgi:GDP-L-fucose synthase